MTGNPLIGGLDNHGITTVSGTPGDGLRRPGERYPQTARSPEDGIPRTRVLQEKLFARSITLTQSPQRTFYPTR